MKNKETLEEAAERLYPENWESIMDGQHDSNSYERTAFINGAKWQQEQDKKLYSELVDLLERLTTIYKEDSDLHQKYDKQRLNLIKQFKNK